MDHFAQIAEERRVLADRLEGLTAEQLSVQSLCDAWTVHDVIAHLVVPLVSTPLDLARAMVSGRFRFHGFNQALVRQQARRSHAELIGDLRARATSRFTPPGMDSQAPLSDAKIHGLDITVPLGVELGRPPETWVPVLDFLVSPPATRAFVRKGMPGVTLTATDTDWSHGEGPEVRGPVTALAAALAGRGALDDQLAGDGLPALLGWQGR